MAKDEFGLLLELNSVFVKDIADKVIDRLLKMKDKSYLLSGDDSGLKNLWEEICIQRQVEFSFYWRMYENVIENIIEDEFEKQPEAIQKLISYISLLEEDLAEDGSICISPEAAVEEIKRKVLERAGCYSNRNIEKYLEER